LKIVNCKLQIERKAAPRAPSNFQFSILNFQFSTLALLTVTSALPAQTLPPVDDADFAALQRQCANLAAVAEQAKGLFDEKSLEALGRLAKEDVKAKEGAERVQKRLDPLCLVGVSINPESRVKAARGPGSAELRKGDDTFVLVRVHNEAGVTNRLTLTGPQLRDEKNRAGWLEASVFTAAPLAKALDGGKVQYFVLRLKAHEAGKREATLKFDVGQGTQDLGFRAEVPILFAVRER
jgi:hypothetical protein